MRTPWDANNAAASSTGRSGSGYPSARPARADAKAVATENIANGRARHAGERRQAVRSEPVLVAGGEDRVHLRLGQGRGERCGRELRSSSPTSPSALYRRSHFQAVWRLTPTMSAAWATAMPSTRTRSTSSRRSSAVSLALRCARRVSLRL